MSGMMAMMASNVRQPVAVVFPPYTFYEAFGTTVAISTTQYVGGTKIYAESSTYDVPSYQPAVVAVNDVEIVNTETRGHTMVVLSPSGSTVSITNYDTYIDPNSATTMANALSAVDSGNIVVLVVYDASSLNESARSAINTGYGSTNTNTWTPDRKSHIFIGVKIAVTSLRSFLSGSGQTAYDAAANNSFFAVSESDFNAVVSGVASVSKVGPSDAQFAGTSFAFSSNYIVTYPQANATVPANNYIIGFRATTGSPNQQWRIYGGPTFKSTSPAYSQISTDSPSTGGGGLGTGTFYYLRKAPTVQAATTYIGALGTQTIAMTGDGAPWTGGAYTNAPFTAWTNWTTTMPKVQVLITPTEVV
jgi:hypothetical protein